MTAEPQPLDKGALLTRTIEARGRLDAALDAYNDDALAATALADGSSIKDLIGHITAWEQRCIGWIVAAERGETLDRPASGLTQASIDAFNAEVFAANKDRSAGALRADSESSYADMLRVIDRLSDSDLLDGSRFSWTNGRPLSLVIRSNADEHYDEHAAEIEALATKPAS